MSLLTRLINGAILLRTAPHWAGGFGDSYFKAQQLCAGRLIAFFMPLALWRVVYWEAVRPAGPLDPVRQPDTSSAALRLATPVGGLNP